MENKDKRKPIAVTAGNTGSLRSRFENMSITKVLPTEPPSPGRETKAEGPLRGRAQTANAAVPPPFKQPIKIILPQKTPASAANNPPRLDQAYGPDNRVAPLAPKPKPNFNRKSDEIANPTKPTPPAVPEAAKEPIKETPKKPEEPIQPAKTQPQKTATTFEISDRWRINYEDLEFGELVSGGSAGEVYLGYYFGTPVAIKQLLLAENQRHLVEREYSMLKEVNHPNIVQFLGICMHASGTYLITEYVEHGDLFDLLVFGDEELDFKTKVRIASQIANAVYYLHSKNIIHRDLKSQNVLIGDNYKVKLCDLGLATVLENRKRMTLCGTDEWMAPEIVFQDTYDSKVDVFSFGIVLTELIYNRPPQKRNIQDKYAFDVQKFTDALPEECPKEFATIVLECTKLQPSERPNFKEICVMLRNLEKSM